MERNRTNAKNSIELFYNNIVLIITVCTSSSGNRGNAGQYGSWAKNSTAFSNPSILQCAWWKKIQYKTSKCD